MLSDQAMQVIREALAIVRRAYEYELAIVQNEDAWNAVVNDVEKRNAEIDAALAELDVLAAQQWWEPLPDGEYDMGNERILYVFGNTDPDVCTHVEFDDDEIMLDYGWVICQRPPVEPIDLSRRQGGNDE